MKRMSLILSAVLFFAFSAGCMSVNTTVVINKDGSGHIIEKTGFLKKSPVDGSPMAWRFPESERETRKALGKRAREFGAGVRFVSWSESEDVNMKYCNARYEFDDINNVIINANQQTDAMVLGEGSGSSMSIGSGKKEPITFRFSEDENFSTLWIELLEASKESYKTVTRQLDIVELKDGTVYHGEKVMEAENKVGFKTKEGKRIIIERGDIKEFRTEEIVVRAPVTKRPGKENREMQEAQGAMAKMMSKGMHFVIRIQCNGEVITANATHIRGNTITLLDVDFERIFKDSEKLEQMQTSGKEGIMENKDILKDTEGARIEFEEEILVRFK
jgi:hypothetical protein